MAPPVPTTGPPLPPPGGDERLVELLGEPTSLLEAAARAVGAAVAPRASALVGGAVAVALVAVANRVARRRDERAMARHGRIIEVLAPPEPEGPGAAALWSNLHGAFGHRRRRPWQGRPHLVWEYGWSEHGMRIRLWVPPAVPVALVARAVEAAWPGAATAISDASQPPLPSGWRTVGGELRLAGPGWFPVRTELDPDPLRPVLAAAACRTGQASVVQVALRPLGRRAARKPLRVARKLRQGRTAGLLGQSVELLVPMPRTRASDPTTNPDVRLILAKADQPLWCALVRYAVAVDPDDGGAGDPRAHAHAVASAFGIMRARNRLVPRRLRGGQRALADRRLREGDLLANDEVAALAHLPLDRIVPMLARAGARPVAPPPALVGPAGDGFVLGVSDAGNARPVVLGTDDARYHLHVMGGTGAGKSTLLIRLVLQDLANRRGAVVVDPNGDLVRDIHAALDPETRARTIVLDPQAPGPVPTLNMLEVPAGVTPDLVVDHLIGIFARIFESSWGPRIEDILRSACLTLLRRPGATLSDVPRVLTIPGEYQRYLSPQRPQDDVDLRGFWAWYEAMSVGQRSQVTGPLLYKLRSFLLRPFARRVVNAPRSSIDLRAVLDGSGLLLARLPKGVLGEDTARLLGSFVTSKTWQAATARAAVPIEARRHCTLYVDECQNFLSLPRSFDEVLAEARKYRLSLVLAHQHLGQLPRELREGISANARNKLYFKTSPEDAKALERHTLPNLTEHDLRNLGAYQVAARLMHGAHEQPAFTFRTTLPADLAPAVAAP